MSIEEFKQDKDSSRSKGEAAARQWVKDLSTKPSKPQAGELGGLELEEEKDPKEKINQLQAEQNEFADSAAAATNDEDRQRFHAEIQKRETQIAVLKSQILREGPTLH